MENETAKDIVAWSYQDHPIRWFVAVVAWVNGMLSVAGVFTGGQDEAGLHGGIFITAIFTAFWLFVVFVCVQPKVDGCFIRRGTSFEIDLGRHVFDLFGGVGEVLHALRIKKSLESVDLGALNSAVMKRWLPRRIRHTAHIEFFDGVSVESGPLGPTLIVRDSTGWMATIDDIPTKDVARILAEITKLKEST